MTTCEYLGNLCMGEYDEGTCEYNKENCQTYQEIRKNQRKGGNILVKPIIKEFYKW